MISTHRIISAIGELKPKTNQVKANKLSELEASFAYFSTKIDPKLEDFFNLKKKCSALLTDEDFTYKKIRLFGLLKSRSEKLVLKLQKDLQGLSLLDIAITKLEAIFANQETFAKTLRQALCDRDYVAAKDLIQSNRLILEEKAPNLYADLNTHLNKILQFSNAYTSKQYFRPLRNPALEHKKSQHVYTLYELSAYMKQAPQGKVFSFIYAIDLNGNIFFSEDANHSFHINLCGGKAVRGAGEIYLCKDKNGMIKVTLLNNKSGLYLPDKKFLPAVLNALKKCGYETNSTKVQDEREKLHLALTQDRILLR